MRVVRALRGGGLALASAAGGVLLAPAGLMAADEPPRMTPAGAPPVAALVVSPAHPAAGAPVTLDASGSTGSIVRYRFDLDGDGSFESGGTGSPRESTTLEPGTRRLAVQVVDASGRADDDAEEVTVAGLEPAQQPAADGPAPRPEPREREARNTRPVATAAASTAVTIQDFLFKPATVSVSVGDTVTWTNRDSAPHTATASGGGFNTGTLKRGESGSHTFTAAGRFAYICAIHPNMHGTVVVSGGSAGGGSDTGGSDAGTTSSGGDSGAPATAAPAAGGSSLPETGLGLLAVILVGTALLGSGAALRRALGRRRPV